MSRFFLIILVFGFLTAGCSQKEEVPVEKKVRISPGPPKHLDVGDQILKHKLPPDVEDGFLQMGEAPDFSYGVMVAHEKISKRNHERSDMLIYVHSGQARIHVADKSYHISMGDVVYIPRGAIYSVISNTDQYPLELLTFYSPPLNPEDIVYHEAGDKAETK